MVETKEIRCSACGATRIIDLTKSINMLIPQDICLSCWITTRKYEQLLGSRNGNNEYIFPDPITAILIDTVVRLQQRVIKLEEHQDGKAL